MNTELRDVTGFRGEKLTELALTDYSQFKQPLFRPGFLADKWPVIDFYVELTKVRGKRPYFFAQTKTTNSNLTNESTSLKISTRKNDILRLLQIPGPTYIIGVHEPSKRVFIRSVHTGLPIQAITRIPLAYELAPENLRLLHNEVRDFWKTTGHKPTESKFA